MNILGIETSCDDTSVAVVRVDGTRGCILAQQTYSQVKEHAAYGGVVPEIASRAHLERLPALVQETLAQAKLELADIDAIATTTGPGLVGALLMGATYGQALALGAGKPFVGVNHLEGHALSPLLLATDKSATKSENVAFPYLLLLVSGGHCALMQVNGVGEYTTLGQTRDDAAGECFDKTARLLKLPSYSGLAVQQAAEQGDPFAFALPEVRMEGLDFSFSGLKTAIYQQVQKLMQQQGELTAQNKHDMAASVQRAVATQVAYKVEQALEQTGLKTLVVAGGVAANTEVRTLLQTVTTRKDAQVIIPPFELCTDNGAMIAMAGGLRFAAGQQDDMAIVVPRWPLDAMAVPCG